MFTRAMRWTYVVFAWIYLAAVVIQFFFAGLFIFHAGPEGLHATLGFSLFFAAILYTLFALAARLPRRWPGLTALLIVLIFLQPMIAFAPVSLIEALHPVNALLIFALASYLAMSARQFIPARALVIPTPEPGLSESRV